MNLENIENSIRRSRQFVVTIFIITIVGYLVWFLIIQKQTLSTNTGDWGTFGDFIGGLLNPLIAYSAFYWLTVSVLVQKQELNETKNALIESSEAQKQQVIGALRDAKIQALNMKFQQLNIILESEISYRNMLAEIGMQNGYYVTCLDKNGEPISAKDQIPACNRNIESLKKEQSEIINLVELLLK